MSENKNTQESREIELLEDELAPIAGGGDGGIATNPGPGQWTPINDPFGESPKLEPIGGFENPVLRDPLGRVGGGVNRGFPGRRPEVEDIEVTGQVKWTNK
jgi:hypothetical protein